MGSSTPSLPPTFVSPERAGVTSPFGSAGRGSCVWRSAGDAPVTSGVEYLLTHLTHLNGEEQRVREHAPGAGGISHTLPSTITG